LRQFQQTAAKAAMRHLQALVVNDGVAYVRQLSPRSRSVGFDFLNRVYAIHQEVNSLEKNAGNPGARMIVAVGPRLRIGDVTQIRQGHLASILRRVEEGTLTSQQAIREAFRSTPVTGGIEELQANFAFTKAFLADQDGSAAGLGGPRCFVDSAIFSSQPTWLSIGEIVKWSTPGLTGEFFEVKGIDVTAAGKDLYASVRDADQLASFLGIRY
jgi:hypothetical protein